MRLHNIFRIRIIFGNYLNMTTEVVLQKSILKYVIVRGLFSEGNV